VESAFGPVNHSTQTSCIPCHLTPTPTPTRTHTHTHTTPLPSLHVQVAEVVVDVILRVWYRECDLLLVTSRSKLTMHTTLRSMACERGDWIRWVREHLSGELDRVSG
jgi:hypothetical protein